MMIKILKVVVLIFVCNVARGQCIQDDYVKYLSSGRYGDYADSLVKYWKCPKKFKSVETQEQYGTYWNRRKNFLINSIRSDWYLKDTIIYPYINDMVQKLVSKNKSYFEKPIQVYIDRSSVVNAYSIGENVLIVNAGLIDYMKTEEQIYFVLAHELAHDALNHSETSMAERAEYFTSDEYEAELKKILDSEYERLTRLKNIYKDYSYDRSKHSRYKEADADSLGAVFLKNAGIGLDPEIFLALDSADMVYSQNLASPLEKYFQEIGLVVDQSLFVKKSKGLSKSSSSKVFGERDDSLKTHPDCSARYATYKDQKSTAPLSEIPLAIHNATKDVWIWNLIESKNLNMSCYRVMLEMDAGRDLEKYKKELKLILSLIYLEDLRMNRFMNLGMVRKEFVSKDFNAMQNYFEQLSQAELKKIFDQIYKEVEAEDEESSYKDLLTFINNYAKCATMESKISLEKSFQKLKSESVFIKYF